jgi:signal transduction histidine kinase
MGVDEERDRRGHQQRSSDQVDVNQLVASGGEMGKLIGSKDWSKTPLGPIETWPQSLRTTVSLCIASNFPIAIIWGPRHVQIYNDGYWPICGPKHPHSMGQDFTECWAPAWPAIGEAFARALAGEPAYLENQRVFVDRKNFLEETFFTFSFSPIRDETGEVGGLFHPVTEVTAKLLSERRTRLLKDVAVSMGRAKTVAEVYVLAARALREEELDLPFVLFYQLAADGQEARLAAACGLEPGSAARQEHVAFDAEPAHAWPLGESVRTGAAIQVDALDARFAPLSCGPYPEPARTALLLPITPPGFERPAAIMVAGVSARLELDEPYRVFYDFLAAAITAAIADATAFEEARLRAEKLAQLDRAKTVFFSNVSHEFRTPLTLILGATEEALARAGALSPAGLEVIRRNGQRLLKLVNTLLDFSRIEAGRAGAQLKPTELGELTAELASSFRSMVEKAGLTLTVDCPPLSEPVYVDREMYEKIVLNLVSNAFKFTFEGEIRVTLRAAEGRALLTVADTGVGIPAQELPHLFERFHRVEGTRGRSYEGSGIGLALVQELARLHGGMVTAQSQLGKGTQFEVSIPLGRALDARAPLESSALVSTSLGAAPFLEEASQWVNANGQDPGAASSARELPVAARQSGRILIVDDNADMRAYAQRLLSEQGWQVEAVPDGEAALQSARARPPDLVLTDVMMPGLDGFGLLRALKQEEKTRAVPVILLSARAGEEAVIEGMVQGADDYLVKPFSGRQLVSVVAARVEIARARARAISDRAWLYAQFMQAPVAVAVMTGPDHVYALANPLYLEMVGRHDLVGKTFADAFKDAPRNSPLIQMFHGVFSSGEPLTVDEFSFPLDRKGSGVFEEAYFKFTIQPVRDAAGQVTDVMVAAVEVTAEVRARQRVESLLAELKLADKRKDEFLATLAHELRNPMAAINTAIALLEHVNADDPKAIGYRETARRQMRNLVHLVDDLLDVSRITRGTVQLRNEEVDLGSIVRDAVTATRALIEARGHDLKVTVEPGQFHLNGDPTRLEQVLVNLLNNAAKYTNPGGTISVALGRERSGGAVQAVLRVRDNGVGIPADMLAKVFDLFVQVDPARDRSTGGLGLGLTLVKNLVEMHGGSVAAYSEGQGKGTEMVVRLPLSTSVRAVPGEVAAPEIRAAPRRRRILIVEDSEDVRDIFRAYLEHLGHQVTEARTGPEGLACLLGARYDLAFVDAGLPGLDGYEVARRVRADPKAGKSYLVALTGHGGPEAKASAEEAGFDLHITKPIDLDVLEGVVNASPPLDAGGLSGL